MDYLKDLFEFLKIDTTSAKGKGEEGAKFLVDYLKDHGINAQLVKHKSKNPYVYAVLKSNFSKASSTILTYLAIIDDNHKSSTLTSFTPFTDNKPLT